MFHLASLARFGLFWLPVTAVGTVALASVWAWTYAMALGGLWIAFQLLLALWMPALAWSRWAWLIRERDLMIASGVIFRSVMSIPLSRVQHVDVQQGPLERVFGLARVNIYTASGSGADGVIPGIELADAEALRDRLVRVEGDAGV
jgi:hypothetical protein